jgi:hypothetical protein
MASVAAALASPSAVRAVRWIPQKASSRVIVDNDFAGDPDGLVALAHQALSPNARLALVTTTALNPRLTEPALAGRSAAAGAASARECLHRAPPGTQVPIVAGPERFGADPSDAARAIVSEAMREDALPLFLTCGGPLTNVAAALRLEPAIAGRMTVIWIGGGGYPDGEWEYNLATDEAAARAVLTESKVPLWQVPKPAYRQMAFSVAELASDMRPISPLGSWLYERFTHPPAFVKVGGTWPLGDSPLVLLSTVGTESSTAIQRPARQIGAEGRYDAEIRGRSIRVFEQIDVRLAWADFLAKLRLQTMGHGA